MTPEVHAAVLKRDGGCLMAKIEQGHVCRDRWGVPHAPDRLELLSLEHVKDDSMMGRRAPSDMSHLVALCHGANVGVPSKEQRDSFRSYLAKVNE